MLGNMKFRSQQLKAQPFLAISILGAFLFLLTLAWLNSLIPLLALLAILAIATFALWMMASDFRNLATLYVIVVLFSPSLFRDLSFVSSGVRLDHIVLACVAFLLLFRLLITGRMRRLNLAVVLFALYIVSALITVWLHLGVNPNSSLIGELVAIQGLARPLIVLVVFSILLRTEQQVKNIVWAVVIGGSVMAVFALLQFIHIDVVVDFTANYFDRKVHPVVLGDRGIGDQQRAASEPKICICSAEVWQDAMTDGDGV